MSPAKLTESEAVASLPDATATGGLRLPELLAPAGDWDGVKAAVENGADAIYFGLDRFNARMRARNFTEADLPRLMSYLHRRGVRGYLTFNTLVFADEMAEAERFLHGIIAAGVDAAIVQDVGICRLIRRLSPDFPIHASTQMTVSSLAGIEFARELGCSLVVLARECSLKDIASIQQAQATAEAPGLPLEVFVHGALCVAYSGQCLTSESLGGRSANRGECAQACRLPYELVSDGKTVPLGDRRYLLSPQDLASVELLPELARLGVASLKIEGRLKSPEYVASITRIYRQALDSVDANPPVAAGVLPTHPGVESPPISPSEVGRALRCPPPPARQGPRTLPGRAGSWARSSSKGNGALATTSDAVAARDYEMQMAFSRGLHTGWFRGINNQELVHARFPKKRGVFLGKVIAVHGDRVHVRLEGPLKAGDGVVFDSGRPDEPEEGGRVYQVRGAQFEARRSGSGVRSPAARSRDPGSEILDPGPDVVIAFGRGDVDFRRIAAGDRLWKTSDPALERELRATFQGQEMRFRRPLALEVRGRAGLPMTLAARDADGHAAEASSAMALVEAAAQPLTTERLREQLGRLGGTPFRLGTLANHLEGAVMLPVSELNQMRRTLVAALEGSRSEPLRWKLNDAAPLPQAVNSRPAPIPDSGGQSTHDHPFENGGATPVPPRRAPELIVLVRRMDQLQAALEAEVGTIYAEFEDPKLYRDAVRLVREQRRRHTTGLPASPGNEPPDRRIFPAIFVAPPRITKPGEAWILKQVQSSEADGFLVRNYDHLRFFAGSRRVGDYSLNVANALSAEHFLVRYGLERLTASYDLTGTQLEALLGAAPPEWFEITIHQHMPMFHMEHCVFCAFLSPGTDYTNCGRPCDRHRVQLRDRVGALHPLKADAGCRNTVFNALAQTGAEYVSRLLALGARHFRIEFLDEPPALTRRTIEMYQRLLRGALQGSQLWRDLRLRHQLGVTRGTLDRGDRPVTVL